MTLYLSIYLCLSLLVPLCIYLDFSGVSATSMHAFLWIIILTPHKHIYSSLKLDMKQLKQRKISRNMWNPMVLTLNIIILEMENLEVHEG